MNTRYWLIRLVPAALVLFAGSGVLKDDDSGVLGVLSYICWFGFMALTLAVIVLLAVAGVRRALGRPAPQSSR
jgi:hypothetical protein